MNKSPNQYQYSYEVLEFNNWMVTCAPHAHRKCHEQLIKSKATRTLNIKDAEKVVNSNDRLAPAALLVAISFQKLAELYLGKTRLMSCANWTRLMKPDGKSTLKLFHIWTISYSVNLDF